MFVTVCESNRFQIKRMAKNVYCWQNMLFVIKNVKKLCRCFMFHFIEWYCSCVVLSGSSYFLITSWLNSWSSFKHCLVIIIFPSWDLEYTWHFSIRNNSLSLTWGSPACWNVSGNILERWSPSKFLGSPSPSPRTWWVAGPPPQYNNKDCFEKYNSSYVFCSPQN